MVRIYPVACVPVVAATIFGYVPSTRDELKPIIQDSRFKIQDSRFKYGEDHHELKPIISVTMV